MLGSVKVMYAVRGSKAAFTPERNATQRKTMHGAARDVRPREGSRIALHVVNVYVKCMLNIDYSRVS